MSGLLTQAKLQTIKGDVHAAIQGVAAKHGVTFEMLLGDIGDGNATLKIGVTVIGAKSREQQVYEVNAASYGLPIDSFGKEFTTGGERYKIIGLNTRARRNPLEIIRVGDGNRMHGPVSEAVLVALGVPAEQAKQFALFNL